MKQPIISLAHAHTLGIAEVGGKSHPLGVLLSKDIIIPNGFVVTSSVFNDLLRENRYGKEIHDSLSRLREIKMKNVNAVSRSLRKKLETVSMPSEIKALINRSFKTLDFKYVAVRSSAACEDQEENSWAGEFETFTWTDEDNLIRNIKQCWSSLYTPRALMYAYERNIEFASDMAVIVQEMVNSDVSGVCLTVAPNDSDPNILIIEAIWGMGELLVHGDVAPDSYWVNKEEKILLDVETRTQKIMEVGRDARHHRKKIPITKQANQKLSGQEIMTIAEIAIGVEDIRRQPQDIEWGLVNNRFYVLQARPIAGINN